jgi:hypothetical protein
MRLEFRGWHSLPQTIDELASADITYLPYWLDDAYSFATRYSFPTKLSTYVAAACPIMFHGPTHAPAAAFIDRFGLGTTCDSLNQNAILESLDQLLEVPFALRVQAGAKSALESEVGQHVFDRRFTELMETGQADASTGGFDWRGD